MVHSIGIREAITLISWVQVSGVGFQVSGKEFDPLGLRDHKLDFPTPLLIFQF